MLPTIINFITSHPYIVTYACYELSMCLAKTKKDLTIINAVNNIANAIFKNKTK